MKSARLSALLAAISVLICVGCQGVGDGRSAAESADRAGNAGAGEATAEDTGGGAAPDEVALEVGGDRGTRFVGTCAVGDGEEKLRGRIPERFVYEPGGRNLECVVRKRGTGTLEVVLVAGESRYVQRVGARWANVSFTYSEHGFASSINSSTPVSAGSGSRTVVYSGPSSVSSSSTESR